MYPVVPVLHACHAVLIWFYNGSIGFTRLPILYCFQCNVCVCLDCQSLFAFKSNARHRWYIPRTVCSLCVGMIQRRWCASILPCASDLFASALGWIPFRVSIASLTFLVAADVVQHFPWPFDEAWLEIRFQGELNLSILASNKLHATGLM